MAIDPMRFPNPAAGYHHIACERRFMWIEQDPAFSLRDKWIQHPVTCPECAADTGLVLAYDEHGGDQVVQVLCPDGHEWPELFVDPQYLVTYSAMRFYADPNPALLWIIDAGFGEEPPPPIDDHVEQLVKGYKEVAKYAARKGRTRVKRAVRKPLRRAKKKALNVAFSPVAATLRAAWILQSGGVPQAAPKRPGKPPRPEQGMKIPSVAAYRKAYGMDAPKRGPKCLVCEDSGRIPGTAIACTECAGPAAAAMAAAERRAERARQGKDTGRRIRGTSNGVVVGPGEKVTGPVQVATGSRKGPVKGAAKAKVSRKAADAVVQGVRDSGAVVNTGVQNIAGGRITGVVQVVGDGQQVNTQTGKGAGSGRPLSAKEAAAVRGAVDAATRAAREAGPGASSSIHVTGKNNSIITSTTSGDAVHVVQTNTADND
ncbi:hypothetical protein AB0D87_38125 [Streptomyces sp. NPDC048342]|uniref:hypothetical protein n=1 Tax=unclassified Streptomyces TaxID=2593676 RepID=UPI003434DC41